MIKLIKILFFLLALAIVSLLLFAVSTGAYESTRSIKLALSASIAPIIMLCSVLISVVISLK